MHSCIYKSSILTQVTWKFTETRKKKHREGEYERGAGVKNKKNQHNTCRNEFSLIRIRKYTSNSSSLAFKIACKKNSTPYLYNYCVYVHNRYVCVSVGTAYRIHTAHRHELSWYAHIVSNFSNFSQPPHVYIFQKPSYIIISMQSSFTYTALLLPSHIDDQQRKRQHE